MGNCRWQGGRDISTTWEQAKVQIWTYFKHPDPKLFQETGTTTTGITGVINGSVAI